MDLGSCEEDHEEEKEECITRPGGPAAAGQGLYYWNHQRYILLYTHNTYIHTRTIHSSYIYTYIHTQTYTKHTCMHIKVYLHTYIHTYIYTYIYTVRIKVYIHTYMHTYILMLQCVHLLFKHHIYVIHIIVYIPYHT